MLSYIFDDDEYSGNPYDYIIDKIIMINKKTKIKKELMPGKDYDVIDITDIRIICEEGKKSSVDILIYLEKIPTLEEVKKMRRK